MTRDRCRVYEVDHPYFLTCTIVGWLRVFTRPERFQIVYDSWSWFCDRERLKVFAYVILENHLHLIASGRELGKDEPRSSFRIPTRPFAAGKGVWELGAVVVKPSFPGTRPGGDGSRNPEVTLPSVLRAVGVRRLLAQFNWEKAAYKTDRVYQVWQEGSHPEEIQSEEMMWEKIEYIHDNPVARGYVDDPLDWRHSSARNYAGQPGVFSVCTDWR